MEICRKFLPFKPFSGHFEPSIFLSNTFRLISNTDVTSEIAIDFNCHCTFFQLAKISHKGTTASKQHMELGMFIPCTMVLLLLSYGAGGIKGGASTQDGDVNGTDLASLLDFKRAITNDPFGAMSSWNTNTHLCRWKGVTCDQRAHRVVALDLVGQTLTGQISHSLGNMSYLTSLSLPDNLLSGRVPPQLGNLRKLVFLDLSGNLLQGIIPEALINCTRLRTLDVSRNHLVGDITPNIALLPNLRNMRLHSNNLTGIIPPEIGNITSLNTVILQGNMLEGSIPEELGKLSNMSYLLLGGNRLSGRIPEVLFNLSHIHEIALPLNMLHGPLTSDLGNFIPNLQQLYLGGNMLGGHIPDSLGNATELQWLDLSYNQGFTGRIPPSLGKLRKIEKLGLDMNNLEARDSWGWEFLDALSNCTRLKMLSLHQNLLQGVLPNSVGNLSSSMDNLVLSNNMLSGLVPSSIGNLHRLTKFGLDFNSFTGPIEGWIGSMVNLQALYLDSNNFTGNIPAAIGNTSQMSELFLSNNQFHGFIPSSLGKLRQLSKLDLSYNNLEGNIPKEVFTVPTIVQCGLSHNNLQGLIPSLSSLQQLSYLDLSSNNLTGEIPPTLGTCQQLGTINMGQNFLSGSIPTSLGNLSILTLFNLSHNNLTGSIPIALSKLQFLTQLDLSDNHLEGQVPTDGVFRNATAISLEGNRQLCGGVLELHMPSCPTVYKSKTGRRHFLVKVLVPTLGILCLIFLAYLAIFRKKMFRKQLPLLPSSDQFAIVSFKDLAQATENFAESNLIGRGSYGSVYKGTLTQENMVVAVKVFHLDMQGADRSFMTECKALRSIRHRNLLPVLTSCSTIDNVGNDFKALVYKFMPNGNLDTWLHPASGTNASNQLSLSQRINIAVDIADALQYLHHDCENPIIHCDLKPSNVLLDHDMTAHLGDFGIAHFYLKSKSPAVGDSSSISSIGLKGTIGYIAPEYAGGGFLSTSGDVYSFGVVLLELLTGKRPTDPLFCNGLSIVSFVERNYPDVIDHIIDTYLRKDLKELAPAMLDEEKAAYQLLLDMLGVALSCTRQNPSERMNMREAATKLQVINISYISGM
ncbi:receptor kinase-like protein Xa21 isoform X1 [Oryza glaberrima]|uniref:receptor kinase-like protein Xa21 isoform X1 n=1 Tax=Oryza glaberrima TaxID=4538 RepID=UPI00224BF4B3|nr:receptor kinase-like protein Xa21 isoform X1 [Oryza glaberrima]